MHIPDGYLGPETCIATYAVMVPVWTVAARRVKRTLGEKQVPVLALTAAFSFLVMMFNVPVPGGTTAHAVGAVLVAILVGPSAAIMVLTLVLVVQALVFGDGGVTALAANALDMAVVMPLLGLAVFRLVSRGAAPGSRRRAIAAGVAGYVGLSAGAALVAVLLGIQPLIAHDALGHALYAPYGLSVTVPAMLGVHLLLLGPVEGIVTGLAVAWLDRAEPAIFASAPPIVAPAGASPPPSGTPARPTRRRTRRRLVFGLSILAILTPLGLLVPRWLGAGSAFGEWSPTELASRVGHVPSGLASAASTWHAPLPDYGLPWTAGAPTWVHVVLYLGSALLGVAILLTTLAVLRRRPVRKEARDGAS